MFSRKIANLFLSFELYPLKEKFKGKVNLKILLFFTHPHDMFFDLPASSEHT